MPLYPEQASNFAPSVDALMVYITAVCLFFAVAITAAVVYFFFKYRRKSAGKSAFPFTAICGWKSPGWSFPCFWP